MDARGPEDGAEVFDFVDEYLRDREAGRARPLSEYLARFRGCEQAIVREWLTLQHEDEQGPAPAPLADDARRVGPWRLVRELGRGGQGAVWLAEDTRIDRRVALKVLPESFALVDGDRRRRMKREAESLARLDHPSICPVLEAEVEGETPYIAMRLIEGQSLAGVLTGVSDLRGDDPDSKVVADSLPVPPRRRDELEAVLAFFEEAARALHAAHESGVVHRDVKPGNVMVTPDGRPVLLDFGQARDENAALDARTLTGEAVGTPAYMSPEQVRGERSAIGARTDVWSLGAALFESLTLTRPFDGASMAELLRAIEVAPLPPARDRNGVISADLSVVLETALEKDVARRYATALDLAEDLRRVREHEPIRARSAGPSVRLKRWAHRNPVIAASLTITFLALTIGLVWTTHLLTRLQSALDHALANHLAKRTTLLIREEPAAALALGIEAVGISPTYETRSALLAALDACYLARFLWGEPSRMVREFDLAGDGRRVAVAYDQGRVRVFDLHTGAVEHDLVRGAGNVFGVRFVDGGRRLVAAGDGGTLDWWDLSDGSLVEAADGPGGAILDLEVDPAGTRLAALSEGGALQLFATGDGTLLETVELPGRDYNSLEFAPDGRRLLVSWRAVPNPRSSGGGRTLLIDEGNAEVARPLGAPNEAATWSTFDPDGERVAIATLEGRVAVWSTADGRLLHGPLDLAGSVWCAEFSPDGARLALACESGENARAFLWDLASDARIPLAGTDQSRVVHVTYSPDGALLATASQDSTCRLFDARDGGPREVLRGFLQPRENLWSLDGNRLITLTNGFNAPVWIARGRPDVYDLLGHEGAVLRAELARAGDRALTLSQDGTARLWSAPRLGVHGEVDPPAGSEVAVLGGDRRDLTGASFTADGARVVTWSATGRVEPWNARDGSAAGPPVELGVAPADLELAPDGARALAIGVDGRVRLEALDGAFATVELEGVAGATTARFSPDGVHVAVGTRTGAVHLFASDGRPRGAVDWPTAMGLVTPSVSNLAFHAGSAELAVARADARIRFVGTADLSGGLREAVTAIPAIALDWNRAEDLLLVIGPEGRGAFRVEDLDDTERMVRMQAFHAGNLTCGSFSPDGSLALTGSVDGTVFVRDARDGSPVVQLVGRGAPILDARFSDDSGRLRVITASADGGARVWPVDPLQAALERKPRELLDWEVAREQRLALPLVYR